jgi:hypothetical protein
LRVDAKKHRALRRLFICGCALLSSVSTQASAVDYYDAVITGVGIAPGEDRIRFTIDKDPNLILTTNDFTGEQLKRLTAMILSAYNAQTPIHMVRSSEASSSPAYHYSNVIFLSLGTRTWD